MSIYYQIERFSRVAKQIRQGKIDKEWRHTSGAMGCYREKDTVHIPGRSARVGNNTWAFFADESERTISIQFHRTVIVKLHSDGAVELASEYNSITTRARHKEFGLSTWVVKGVMYVAVNGCQLPAMAGLIDRQKLVKSIPYVDILLQGSRAGDPVASDRLAAILRDEGYPDMADCIASLRGRVWGGAPRTMRKLWDDMAVPLDDGTWLGCYETGEPIRPYTTRDVACSSGPVSAVLPLVLGNDRYWLVNGFTKEPLQGWEAWLDNKRSTS